MVITSNYRPRSDRVSAVGGIVATATGSRLEYAGFAWGWRTVRIFEAKGSIPLDPIGFYIAIVNTGRAGIDRFRLGPIGAGKTFGFCHTRLPSSLERPPWKLPSLFGSKLDPWSF
ncbi:hypothetical protein RCH23_000182 [Cryobacterium sp. CAN_C3]|nr:hypothetical protein [Cryobacterium sp. CAN_C3]